MSSKTFLTISKDECLIVYKNVLDNSNQKWETGIKLSEIEDYGNATSMAIISVEELVKSLILLLDAKGFEFRRVKGMDSIFNHHQLRYLMAYAMFIMSVFGEELLKLFKRFRDNPDELTKYSELINSENDFFEKRLKFYLLKKLIQIKKEFGWFSQVDIFRQDGFYCDYEGQLKNPITITKSDYQEVYQRLLKVRNLGIGIIETLNIDDKHTSEHLNKLRRDFKKNKHYNKIEESLSKVRQTRGGPFEHIKQNFKIK